VNDRERLAECEGFDWDDGNLEKNWETHRVAYWEAEEVFLNEPLLLKRDSKHSVAEPRLFVLGETNAMRRLFVSFTFREKLVRVISARNMNRREERQFEKYEKENPALSK